MLKDEKDLVKAVYYNQSTKVKQFSANAIHEWTIKV